MIDTESMGNTFILEENDMVWELGLEYVDEAANKVVSTVDIRITSASKAAQLPLQPVGSEPKEQPSGWAQGYVKEAVEAGIVPPERLYPGGYAGRVLRPGCAVV